MRAMRRLLAILTATGLLFAVWIGPATAASGVRIIETNGRYSYSPKTITVALGDTVVWTNKSDATHTVDADDKTSFESKQVKQNQTFQHTFTTAGTFAYHCDIHPYMKAQVVVLAAGMTPPATDTEPGAGSTTGGGTWIVLVAMGLGLLAVALVLRKRVTVP